MIKYPINYPLDYPIFKRGGVQSSMADIVSSCILDLDTTISASYDGTSQTWANLVSGSTEDDFWLGADNTTANDPTFSGSGITGRFVHTGSSFLKQKSIGYQYDASKGFGLVLKFKTGTLDTGWHGLVLNTSSTIKQGFWVFITGSTLDLVLCDKTNSKAYRVSSFGSLASNTDYELIVSTTSTVNPKKIEIYLNGTLVINSNYSPSTSTDSATPQGDIHIGSNNAGSGLYQPSGAEVSHFSMYNDYLTGTDVSNIQTELTTRRT